MTATMLKFIALFFMVIDHIGFYLPEFTPIWFRLIGRIAAPIFFFLLIEGYHNTRSKKEYKKRLFKYSIYMSITNLFIISIYSLLTLESPIIGLFIPNIFLTMLVCFIFIEIIEKIKCCKKLTLKLNLILLLFAIVFLSVFIEYNLYALFMISIFYAFRNNKLKLNFFFILGSLILPILDNNPTQMGMILSLIFINEYNGNLYNNTSKPINKFFFYNFYIIHIVILTLANLLINL